MFTPFGEEILFRGVIANALDRYGAFAGIVLSSIIFGLAHGLNVILAIAIMVGIAVPGDRVDLAQHLAALCL